MAHHVAYTPRSFEGRRAFCEIARGWVEISQRIQRPVEDGMGAEGSLLIMNSVVSQSLLHLHLHVIPQHRQDWPRFFPGSRHPYASRADAEKIATRTNARLRAPGAATTTPESCRLSGGPG